MTEYYNEKIGMVIIGILEYRRSGEGTNNENLIWIWVDQIQTKAKVYNKFDPILSGKHGKLMFSVLSYRSDNTWHGIITKLLSWKN